MNEPSRLGGPRTPEGKLRSSLNALKHGLDARSPQAFERLAEQSGLAYEDILEEMNRHYLPADPVERQLVARIARCVWRLSISSAMEARLMARRPEVLRPSSTYDRILKYERLVDIHLHRALTTLLHKREIESRPHKNNPENEPPAAIS